MRINFLVCALLICALQAPAQQATATHADVSRTLSGMNSEDWVDRERALAEMPNLDDLGKRAPAEADRLKLGLINSLNIENEEVHKSKSARTRPTIEKQPDHIAAAQGEGHANYYGNLIGIVAALNDERAIPALLGAITTGGMAERGIAVFGDKAVQQLLEKIQDQDPIVRSSILFTVRQMLRIGSVKNPASQARLREIVRSSLDDTDPSVRSSAISVVEWLDNREEFVPALEKLAQSDPVRLPGRADDGGDQGQFYPVRQHARKMIRKIENHEVPRVDRGLNP